MRNSWEIITCVFVSKWNMAFYLNMKCALLTRCTFYLTVPPHWTRKTGRRDGLLLPDMHGILSRKKSEDGDHLISPNSKPAPVGPALQLKGAGSPDQWQLQSFNLCIGWLQSDSQSSIYMEMLDDGKIQMNLYTQKNILTLIKTLELLGHNEILPNLHYLTNLKSTYSYTRRNTVCKI